MGNQTWELDIEKSVTCPITQTSTYKQDRCEQAKILSPSVAHCKPRVNSDTSLVNTPTPLLLWYVVRVEKDNLPTRIPEGSVGRTLQTRNTQPAIFPTLRDAQYHYQTIAVYEKKSHGQGTNCMWSLNNVKATHLLRSRPTLTKIKIDSFVARLAKKWKSLRFRPSKTLLQMQCYMYVIICIFSQIATVFPRS